MAMLSFQNRTALVTGAASGIGLATARHLAGQGVARLMLVDRDGDALSALSFDCDTLILPGDVADEHFWAPVEPMLARIDHVVVNAGIAGAAPIAELSFDEWRRIMAVNLDGAFLTIRSAMRAMKLGGGSIVAVASAAGIKAEPGVAAYGASKAGLIQLVKVAAKEGAPDRIRVNAIAPAGVETPVWNAIPMFADRVIEIGRDAAFAELAAMATPLGRYAKAEEIAAQIAFLLSGACATVTGSVFVSDGGYLL